MDKDELWPAKRRRVQVEPQIAYQATVCIGPVPNLAIHIYPGIAISSLQGPPSGPSGPLGPSPYPQPSDLCPSGCMIPTQMNSVPAAVPRSDNVDRQRAISREQKQSFSRQLVGAEEKSQRESSLQNWRKQNEYVGRADTDVEMHSSQSRPQKSSSQVSKKGGDTCGGTGRPHSDDITCHSSRSGNSSQYTFATECKLDQFYNTGEVNASSDDSEDKEEDKSEVKPLLFKRASEVSLDPRKDAWKRNMLSQEQQSPIQVSYNNLPICDFSPDGSKVDRIQEKKLREVSRSEQNQTFMSTRASVAEKAGAQWERSMVFKENLSQTKEAHNSTEAFMSDRNSAITSLNDSSSSDDQTKYNLLSDRSFTLQQGAEVIVQEKIDSLFTPHLFEAPRLNARNEAELCDVFGVEPNCPDKPLDSPKPVHNTSPAPHTDQLSHNELCQLNPPSLQRLGQNTKCVSAETRSNTSDLCNVPQPKQQHAEETINTTQHNVALGVLQETQNTTYDQRKSSIDGNHPIPSAQYLRQVGPDSTKHAPLFDRQNVAADERLIDQSDVPNPTMKSMANMTKSCPTDGLNSSPQAESTQGVSNNLQTSALRPDIITHASNKAQPTTSRKDKASLKSKALAEPPPNVSIHWKNFCLEMVRTVNNKTETCPDCEFSPKLCRNCTTENYATESSTSSTSSSTSRTELNPSCPQNPIPKMNSLTPGGSFEPDGCMTLSCSHERTSHWCFRSRSKGFKSCDYLRKEMLSHREKNSSDSSTSDDNLMASTSDSRSCRELNSKATHKPSKDSSSTGSSDVSNSNEELATSKRPCLISRWEISKTSAGKSPARSSTESSYSFDEKKLQRRSPRGHYTACTCDGSKYEASPHHYQALAPLVPISVASPFPDPPGRQPVSLVIEQAAIIQVLKNRASDKVVEQAVLRSDSSKETPLWNKVWAKSVQTLPEEKLGSPNVLCEKKIARRCPCKDDDVAATKHDSKSADAWKTMVVHHCENIYDAEAEKNVGTKAQALCVGLMSSEGLPEIGQDERTTELQAGNAYQRDKAPNEATRCCENTCYTSQGRSKGKCTKIVSFHISFVKFLQLLALATALSFAIELLDEFYGSPPDNHSLQPLGPTSQRDSLTPHGDANIKHLPINREGKSKNNSVYFHRILIPHDIMEDLGTSIPYQHTTALGNVFEPSESPPQDENKATSYDPIIPVKQSGTVTDDNIPTPKVNGGHLLSPIPLNDTSTSKSKDENCSVKRGTSLQSGSFPTSENSSVEKPEFPRQQLPETLTESMPAMPANHDSDTPASAAPRANAETSRVVTFQTSVSEEKKENTPLSTLEQSSATFLTASASSQSSLADMTKTKSIIDPGGSSLTLVTSQPLGDVPVPTLRPSLNPMEIPMLSEYTAPCPEITMTSVRNEAEAGDSNKERSNQQKRNTTTSMRQQNQSQIESKVPYRETPLSIAKKKLKKKSRFYVPKTGDLNKHWDRKRKGLDQVDTSRDYPRTRDLARLSRDLSFEDSSSEWQGLTNPHLDRIVIYITIFMLTGCLAVVLLQILIHFSGGHNVCTFPFLVLGTVCFFASGIYFLNHVLFSSALLAIAALLIVEALIRISYLLYNKRHR